MATDMSSIIGGIGNGLLKSGVYILLTVFFGGILAGFLYLIQKQRKFREYIVRIFEKDSAGNLITKTDGGAIFLDKKANMQCFFLQNAKIGLSSNRVPYIVNARGNKEVYLYKSGERNYRFVPVSLDTDGIQFTVGDEDVNQALLAMERAKKTYITGWLEKFLPYIVIGIVLVIFLIAFVYSMQQWEKAAQHFANLASALQNINRTTTIIAA